MWDMGVKCKQHGAKFKAQVVMAALAGDKALVELSSEYGVHVTMITPSVSRERGRAH
jgi:transposase